MRRGWCSSARHSFMWAPLVARLARRSNRPEADRRGPRPPDRAGLRPPDANGNRDIDRSKTTKGRHMARGFGAQGAKAPAFTLPRDGGATVSLKDFKGRNLVLYFYPKADTPGCTQGSHRILRVCARRLPKPGPRSSAFPPIRSPRRTSSKPSTNSTIALASDETQDDARSLWRLGRKIDVWPQIHGRHPQDLPDRWQGPHRPRLAESVAFRAMPRRSWPPRKSSVMPVIAAESGADRASLPAF